MHVFSIQSCVWETSNPSEANIKIQHVQQSKDYAELSGLDGEPMEFQWNVFPGFTSIEILRQIQRDVNVRRINSDHFEAKAFVFLSLGDEDKWCGSCNHVPEVSMHLFGHTQGQEPTGVNISI